jgi:hypothetical protein
LVCKTVKDIATKSDQDLIKMAEWHIGKNQLISFGYGKEN